jgi:hypothetical protein
MPQYIPEYPAPITTTFSGLRFSTGESLSLKDDLMGPPFVMPLVWMPGVSEGRLGIADIVNEKK